MDADPDAIKISVMDTQLQLQEGAANCEPFVIAIETTLCHGVSLSC